MYSRVLFAVRMCDDVLTSTLSYFISAWSSTSSSRSIDQLTVMTVDRQRWPSLQRFVRRLSALHRSWSNPASIYVVVLRTLSFFTWSWSVG